MGDENQWYIFYALFLLDEFQQVKTIAVMHDQVEDDQIVEELDADDAELTRTRKVRRRLVAQRYDDIISALYSQNPYIDVETVITYQDGRTATLQTRLRIENLDGVEQT